MSYNFSDKQGLLKGKNTLKILVVDDDETTLGFYKKLLQGAGHNVAVATDSSKAIFMLEHDDYDILIQDLVRPDMSGVELLEELSNRKKDIPTIIISGNLDKSLGTVIRKFNCVAYFKKPFDAKQVLAVLDNLTGRQKRNW
jgi:DNA-binding response OmpR family regulator